MERTPAPGYTTTPAETMVAADRTPVATKTPTKVLPTPTGTKMPTGEPTVVPTSTSETAAWETYDHPAFGVSLRYPSSWQLVSGEEGRKYAGEDGFFILDAIGNPMATIDEIAASQTGHVLLPYGKQPTIESLQIQGQEARLILPSADASMGGQAMLIVRYPRPVQIAGATVEFFALYADQEHIRSIAQSLRFTVNASSTDTDGSEYVATRADLPPGLTYRLSDALWLVDADGHQVRVSSDQESVFSTDGRQIISYNPVDQDPWLLDLATGTGWNLTRTPGRTECCARWWPERPGVVLLSSTDVKAEPMPGVMGYLTSANVDGTGYQILDPEHDTGPGLFAPSPDGQTVAYGGGSTGWLYRWGGGAQAFDPTEYGLTGSKEVKMGSPSWSPDGAKMAWVVGGGLAADGGYRIGVGVFDLQARTAYVLHPYVPSGRGGWPPAAAWSPDGEWLAFVTWDELGRVPGVWMVRINEQEEIYLGRGDRPVWSPDGRWLAFDSAPEGSQPGICVVEVGTRKPQPLNLPPDAHLAGWIVLGD